MSIDLVGHRHVHVSEREAAHEGPCGTDNDRWEDCFWVAIIELLRATGHPEIPATHEEAEALRCQAGVPRTGDTSSVRDVRTGVKRRYGVALPPTRTGGATIWAALTPGTAAFVTGRMGRFNTVAQRHWRRWDPTFTAGHAAFVARLSAANEVWWCDGLAPLTITTRPGTAPVPWDGELMPKDHLLTFASSAIVATIVPHGGNAVIYAPAKRTSFHVLALTSIFNEPNGTQIEILSSAGRFEVIALGSTSAGSVDPSWTALMGLKEDGVTPDLNGPTLVGWCRADRLLDPADVPL